MTSREAERVVLTACRGRTVLVGIGSPFHGDDAVGLLLARCVRRRLPHAFAGVVLGGTSPEACTGAIAALQPETVLLADAVAMGALPGTAALLTAADLAERVVWEGHRSPLTLLMQYLSLRTGAAVMLLGIQPQTIGWGVPLSPAVRQSVRDLLAGIERQYGVFCPREEPSPHGGRPEGVE